VDPLADPDRLLKQRVEDWTHRLMRLTKSEGGLHLPENLALTDHHRVEAGRHRERMSNCPLVEENRTQRS
jgi:hypothetical protein